MLEPGLFDGLLEAEAGRNFGEEGKAASNLWRFL